MTCERLIFAHAAISESGKAANGKPSSPQPPREPLPWPRISHPGSIRQRQSKSLRHRQPSLSQSHGTHLAAPGDPAKLPTGLANPSQLHGRANVLGRRSASTSSRRPSAHSTGASSPLMPFSLPRKPHAPGGGVETDAVTELAEDVEHHVHVAERQGAALGGAFGTPPPGCRSRSRARSR